MARRASAAGPNRRGNAHGRPGHGDAALCGIAPGAADSPASAELHVTPCVKISYKDAARPGNEEAGRGHSSLDGRQPICPAVHVELTRRSAAMSAAQIRAFSDDSGQNFADFSVVFRRQGLHFRVQMLSNLPPIRDSGRTYNVVFQSLDEPRKEGGNTMAKESSQSQGSRQVRSVREHRDGDEPVARRTSRPSSMP